MFKIFERLLTAVVFLPPVYIAVRFIRWYTRQEHRRGPKS
jgi:hypothetical protein